MRKFEWVDGYLCGVLTAAALYSMILLAQFMAASWGAL